MVVKGTRKRAEEVVPIASPRAINYTKKGLYCRKYRKIFEP